jgi:bacterioferritin-associated ferredoxin
MTTDTTTLSLVAAMLTDEDRGKALTELAGKAEWMRHGEVTAELAKLAHRSLSPGRRADLFESFKEHIERATALRAGVAYWTEFFDASDFLGTCGDCQDRAAELIADRAAELLFALVHGEGEK